MEIEPHAYFRIASEDGPNGLLFTLSTGWESAEGEVEGDPYEDLRKIDTLVLEHVFPRDIGIALGPMDEVLDFMGDCTEALVAGWGLDPEAQKKRKQAPKIVNLPQAGRQIAQTYPIGPLKRSQNGRVNLRLMVDAAGNASDCFVEPPVLPEFRETACQETLKYARFEPALDADGQPIASYYVTSIVYWLN